MIKNIQILSLSAGTIGEDFVKHEVDLGFARLKEFGLNVTYGPHALSGRAYVSSHPKERADVLLAALSVHGVDMILCAIGGEDTYRLLPYLFENGELAKVAKQKVFLGFSDSTINHLMLHKVGIKTFYGQSFLADVCDMAPTMLPYSEHYFKELIETGTISEIRPADVWYEGRTDWSPAALGTWTTSHKNEGFQLLQGPSQFSGEILGGCIETLYDIFDNTRFSDTVSICQKYDLFPSLEDWKGKILLLETSEELSSIEHYRHMLETLKKTGVFGVVSGVLVGKPMDEFLFEEVKLTACEVIDNPNLPILANINVGHATPRCIIPFGVEAFVDAEKQVIKFK